MIRFLKGIVASILAGGAFGLFAVYMAVEDVPPLHSVTFDFALLGSAILFLAASVVLWVDVSKSHG